MKNVLQCIFLLLVSSSIFGSDESAFTCADKLLQMVGQMLQVSDDFNRISGDEVRELMKRPAMRVEFQRILATQKFLKTEEAFVQAIVRRMNLHTYSAVDLDERAIARRAIVGEALQETGLTLPHAAKESIGEVLAVQDHVRDPKISEEDQLEANAQMAKVARGLPIDDILLLYKSFLQDCLPKGSKKPRLIVLSRTPQGALDRYFFAVTVLEMRHSLKQNKAIESMLREHIWTYVLDIVKEYERTVTHGSIDTPQSLNVALSRFLQAQKIHFGAHPVIYRLICSRALTSATFDAPEIRELMTVKLAGDLSFLRRELLMFQREEARAASLLLPEGPLFVSALQPTFSSIPVRPAETRRRRLERQASVSNATPNAPSPTAVKEAAWTAEKTEWLFRRLCPTNAIYRKFVQAMDEAKRKLTAREFFAFQSAIVTALRNLQDGADPLKERGVEKSTSRLVWKVKPLSGSTIRLFLGRIHGEFYIMELLFDSKSGENHEHRVIEGLDREIHQFEAAWKD
jgi:hypothetical protein